EKGFEAMTVDAVVADVGIGKASLYKHFTSKEELAAAAMVRVLDRALDEVARLRSGELDAVSRLKALAGWAYQQQIAGQMPALPSQSSALRSVLVADKAYTERLIQLSDALGEWITEAQADGRLDAALPPELVLYSLYARACDPVLPLLRASGAYSDEQVVAWLVDICFRGLGA
ncbi:MAG: TetR/AcrR family transcriptional regulator, partial [Variovorax sp.]